MKNINTKTQNKKFSSLQAGGMRVSNEEFALSLQSYMFTLNPDSFTNPHLKQDLQTIRLPLNPGDGRTFPWLSAIARRYEHYEFKTLEFLYKPAVSTLANGNVAMGPIYDPADSQPSSRTVLLNLDGVVRTQVYKESKLTIPPQRLRNGKMYIRSTGDHVIDPGELRNTDLGFVVIGLTDTSTSDAIYGDIFVRYTVDFHGPRIGSSGARMGVSSTKFNSAAAYLAPDASIAPFGIVRNRWNSEFTKKHNSDKNTLDYEIGYDSDTYSVAGSAIHGNIVKFNEPFTGLMHIDRYQSSSNGTVAPFYVNGYQGSQTPNSSTGNGLVLKPGKAHKFRQAAANFVSYAKDGAKAIKEVWTVVADVGDIIHLATTRAGTFPINTESTALSFLETAEEALPVMAGFLV